MIDKLAIACNIRRDQRSCHCRGFKQAPWHPFAIGWQHDSRGLRYVRPNVFGMPKMLDQALVRPFPNLAFMHSAAVFGIEVTQQLESPARSSLA